MEHLSGFGPPSAQSETKHLKSLMVAFELLHAGYLGPRGSLFQNASPVSFFPAAFAFDTHEAAPARAPTPFGQDRISHLAIIGFAAFGGAMSCPNRMRNPRETKLIPNARSAAGV